MSETNRIEYKQELTDKLDIEKEVIAFLNYHEGGFVYIGINKLGKVFGVNDLDSDMLKLKDRIKNNILPSCMGLFDIQSEQKDGKDIIKVIIASGSEKPYYKKKYGMTEKGCFIRIGTAADPMQQKIIDELFAKRTRNSLGRIVSRKQDLKFEQLKIYYESAGLKLNEHFASNLELLTDSEEYNYVAYLFADNNSTSIKVAKYSSNTRVDLTENNEYGFACLIRAAKQVLDKIEVENPTATQITSKERQNQQNWDPIALREAVINAFVHNDFTGEVPPKFEIFPDRIEITSTGGLPEGLSQEEFFEGFSVPRNKELMRVFKDLDMVEQLGSGVPRILQSYDKNCFIFSANFLRMTFPIASGYVIPQVTLQVIPQVTPQVQNLYLCLDGELTRSQIQELLKLSDRKNFNDNYLKPALKHKIIEMTIPEKPNSSKQKYKLTDLGMRLKKQEEKED